MSKEETHREKERKSREKDDILCYVMHFSGNVILLRYVLNTEVTDNISIHNVKDRCSL